MRKSITGLSIAMLFLMGVWSFPKAIFAETMPEDSLELKAYQRHQVKVEEVYQNGNILVQGDDDFKLVVLTKGKNILDLNTGDFTEVDHFEIGQKLVIFIRNDTIFLQSMPPQAAPQLIAIHPGMKYNVDMDLYDDGFVGAKNRLVLTGFENTQISTLDGERKDKEDLVNEELIVLYSISTRSLPPQTNPDKIWIWKDTRLEEGGLTDEFLSHHKIQKGEEEVYPLRLMLEYMGVDVQWKNDLREIILSYQGQQIRLNTDGVIKNKNEKIRSFDIDHGVSHVNEKDLRFIWDLLQ
ncbi:MAG: hypothetical protein Q4P25_00715 [Tissierellia bacterium]|nr:hypothetical protein [Tissierellia bacterium]